MGKRLKKEYILSFLALLIAAFVWQKVFHFNPILTLPFGIFVMLLLPGYLLSTLFFQKFSRSLEVIEQLPIFFGLSLTFWTILSAIAYQIQLPTNFVIGIIIFLEIGTLIFLQFKYFYNHYPTSLSEINHQTFFSHKLYLGIFLLLIGIIGVLGAINSQFQGFNFDTLPHLAAYRKIAASSKIIGGDVLYQQGAPYLFHYASNPWYLFMGLTARLSHVDVVWLYISLVPVLTLLMFFTFYSMLKSIIFDPHTALLGSIMVTIPWISELAIQWKNFHSFYLGFFPYPYTVSELILLPLLLTSCFRYIYKPSQTVWLLTSLLAIATIGQHVLFVIWTPLFLGFILLTSNLIVSSKMNRFQNYALFAEICLIAFFLLFLQISFPLALAPSPMNPNKILLDWSSGGSVWILGKNFFASSPQYLLTTGWKQLLGFMIIAGFIGFTQGVLFIKKDSRRRLPQLTWIPSRTWHLMLGVFAVIVGPWIVIFNPLLVPQIVQLFGSSIPIMRVSESMTVFSHVLIFGTLACLLSLLFSLLKGEKKGHHWKTVVLIVGLLLICSPLLSKSVRVALANSLSDNRDTPSLLNLQQNKFYQELSQHPPGVVAITFKQADMVAALTPHYVLAVQIWHNTNLQEGKKRLGDNEKIINFSVNFAKMQQLLKKYNCRYIVIARNSPHLSRFKIHSSFFKEIIETPEQIVLEVL